MPHAVMGGSGWAADADLVGGTTHIGDIVPQQLPCQGTDGQTRTNALASATVPGVSIGGLQGKANGRITKHRPGPRLDRGLGRPCRARAPATRR